MTQAPRRAHVLKLEIGADTLRDIEMELRNISTRIAMEGLSEHSVMGGPTCNHELWYEVDETMTHDRYFELVDAYLAERRAEKEKT